MQRKNFDSLSFDGAGIIGPFAYGPALLKAYELGFIKYDQIRYVIGNSSGAMCAIGACIDKPEEILPHLSSFDTSKLVKPRSFAWMFFNGLKNLGTHDNTGIRNSIENIVQFKHGKKDITFGEIQKQYHKDLYIITATTCKVGNTYTCIPFVFSPYNAANTSVVLIALASTAIPGYFPYIRLKKTSDGCYEETESDGNIYFDAVFIPSVDPINLLVDELNKNNSHLHKELQREKILGFGLKSKKNYATEETSLPLFCPHIVLWSILNKLIYDFRQLSRENSKQSIIYVDPVGVSPVNFKINAEEKSKLFISGSKSSLSFFNPDKDLSTLEMTVPKFREEKKSYDEYLNWLSLLFACIAFIRGTNKNNLRAGLFGAAKAYFLCDTVSDIITKRLM